MSAMTDEQKKHFREAGYLLASGLIPEHVVRKAEDAMWAALEMDRDDPETWGVCPCMRSINSIVHRQKIEC
ncbi:MAG: hypothetical protein F4Z86_00775 [Gemmatimonadetes bacterium]|nr:hypothetical protein [Gemmatimonadota bacterium]